MNTQEIPASVRATLWSYDVNRMDIVRDSTRIITNVLNYGTTDATTWLFSTYTHDEIKKIAEHPRPGEWNKKSLNYWSIVFNIVPQIRTRF